jgi:hypothetical protein
MNNDDLQTEAASFAADRKRALGLWPSTVVGTAVGSAFFLMGYLLVVGNQESFATVMFVLVPFVSGFSIAAVTRDGVMLGACCFSTWIVSLLVLIVVGFEGYICCLMALPLIAIGTAIGALIGYFVRGRFLDASSNALRNKALLMVAAPVLIVSANQLEKPHRSVERMETFATSVEVIATPNEVWPHIVRMPNLSGDKPFLLRIGLPVPDHCTLEGEAVGATRVCHFDQGIIGQEVTEWDEPRRFAVKTTQATLPGRHWLRFGDAEYDLKVTPNGTLVTRRSSIGSKLYPRWYWRPFEAWGVESEHVFVLSSLKQAVEEKK